MFMAITIEQSVVVAAIELDPVDQVVKGRLLLDFELGLEGPEFPHVFIDLA